MAYPPDPVETRGSLPAKKPARFSQCEKILTVLRDGKPHTTAEIHERAGYSRLNSRIAELRKRGWIIESFHVDGKTGPAGYGYRLVCTEDPPSNATPHVDGNVASPPSVQLSFGAAA